MRAAGRDKGGCTDTDATNYDSTAVADDASCVYAGEKFSTKGVPNKCGRTPPLPHTRIGPSPSGIISPFCTFNAGASTAKGASCYLECGAGFQSNTTGVGAAAFGYLPNYLCMCPATRHGCLWINMYTQMAGMGAPVPGPPHLCWFALLAGRCS